MTSLSRALGLAVASLLCVFVLVPSTHAQTITINEAREKGVDSTVTVEGTVTRAFGDFVRFEDESGPTGASGLVVRQTSGAFRDSVETGAIRPGTQLRMSGTLSPFNGLLQINEEDLNDFAIQGQSTVPPPQDVELATLRSNGEDYESELVRVTGLDFVTARGSFENRTSYAVTDESGTATFAAGTLTFRVQTPDETDIAGEPIPQGTIEYTGVVGEFSGQYQLIPVQPSDAQPVRSFGFTRQFVQAEEGSGTVEVDVKAFATESGDDVSVTAMRGRGSTADAGDVTGFDGSQTLSFSGSDPDPKALSFEPVDDGTDEGVERLEVVLESSDGEIARPQRFTLWLLDAPAVQTTIAEGDSGDALIDSLQQQFADPRPLGDDFARDSMYAVIYNEAGNVVEGQYSGFQITVDPSQGDPSTIAANKGINNEHTWPQSQGAGEEPATSDLHILVPARAEVNSARSNFPYGEIPDADTDQWFFEDQSQTSPPPDSERPLWSELLSGQNFEPRHSVKGDVARAAFYFVTTYPNRANFSFFDEQKETLLDWHEQDPVDATEMRRNLIQAGYQDNVPNPFVLDATLADRAYGSGGGTPGGDAIPISEARSQGVGAAVTVEGVVSRAFGAYLRFQDGSGSTGASGLVLRQTSGGLSDNFQQDIQNGTIRPGTELRVTGELSAFNGLLQVNNDDLNGYEVLGQGEAPAPQTVSLSEIDAPDGEDFESELLRVDGLSFPSASGSFSGSITYTVEGETGTPFEFRVQDSEETDLIGTSIPTGSFSYEGVLGQFNGDGFVEGADEGYQLIPVRPETALPVEMAGFEAAQSDGAVELTWQTASETNNAGFQVQRKSGAQGEWTQIGFREGGGTTETAQTYRFTDATPPFEADALTYRLKQVDLDGSASFSEPITLRQTVDQVTLRAPFPNPTPGPATVQFAVPERQDVSLRLYDVLGRQVRTLVAGKQTEGRQEAQIDVANLSSGTYFLRLRAGGQVHTERVTVLR